MGLGYREKRLWYLNLAGIGIKLGPKNLSFTRNDKKFDMALTGVMDGCAWCEAPKDEWSDIESIKAGFELTRTLPGLQALWEDLDKNRQGELIRRTGDYRVRKGLCHKPVTTRPLWHFTVCHKVIFSPFDHGCDYFLFSGAISLITRSKF